MEEIVEQYRKLSHDLTFINDAIRLLKSIIEEGDSIYPSRVKRMLCIAETTKKLINATINSLANQIPIIQHF